MSNKEFRLFVADFLLLRGSSFGALQERGRKQKRERRKGRTAKAAAGKRGAFSRQLSFPKLMGSAPRRVLFLCMRIHAYISAILFLPDVAPRIRSGVFCPCFLLRLFLCSSFSRRFFACRRFCILLSNRSSTRRPLLLRCAQRPFCSSRLICFVLRGLDFGLVFYGWRSLFTGATPSRSISCLDCSLSALSFGVDRSFPVSHSCALLFCFFFTAGIWRGVCMTLTISGTSNFGPKPK